MFSLNRALIRWLIEMNVRQSKAACFTSLFDVKLVLELNQLVIRLWRLVLREANNRTTKSFRCKPLLQVYVKRWQRRKYLKVELTDNL